MKCNHTDCCTCPYPECISEKGPKKKSKGRKKLDSEVRKQRARDYQKVYYAEHREECALYAQKYYEKNKDSILEKQRQKQLKLNGGKRVRELTIWVTNGVDSKRIKEEQYEEYVAKGYRKGRTLKPYKNSVFRKDEYYGY